MTRENGVSLQKNIFSSPRYDLASLARPPIARQLPERPRQRQRMRVLSYQEPRSDLLLCSPTRVITILQPLALSLETKDEPV